MKQAKLLLDSLTNIYPPPDGKRHHITLGNNGDLEISIATHHGFLPVCVRNSGLNIPAATLIGGITALIDEKHKESGE